MKSQSDRLKKLQQRHADLQLKIKQEQHKLIREERRRDTRRKILAGVEALAEAQQNDQWKARLWQLLDKNLERDSDRKLFALATKK